MLKFGWDFLWTIINLLIFFVLMKVFLFKPIKKTMDKRKELIEEQFKEADSAKAEADELKAQYETQLEEASDEKQRIINEAKDSAQVEYDKIIDRAKSDANQLKTDARKSVELECEQARRAVKDDIVALAMQTAQKVVGDSVSAQTDSDIFDEFLKESSDGNE
jgi:F-type H+-transporting ATPase subunit b